VRDLPGALRPGDALVFNDTRVIPARLNGVRTRPGAPGQRTEVLLHLREAPDRWRAFARPAKRLSPGDALHFGHLTATVVEKGEAGEVVLAFDRAGPDLDAAIAVEGALPLPPYIAGKRATDARDATDYQTVYARNPGAVAAPTAGLHFSEALLADLDAAGLRRHHVTLHVGAGTFLPVKAEDTDGHRMHAEIGLLDAATAEALNATRANGGRIVAVGTTALRLLESAARPDGTLAPFSRPTDIFITPGYRFRAIDALVTNFHLPRSTLFMLVSAFSGLETMRAAYAHAIRAGYRFYSYGDASLLFPGPGADTP
jgi:S-adenosylmethionine:tRNA ribosyltransferase-isomerase